MSGGAVVWAETPEEDDGDETTASDAAQGDVDESMAARRLRRWIKGMFGGRPTAAEPPEEPGRAPDA